MPSGNTLILWNENTPADGDNAGNGDDEIRSFKTSVRAAMSMEHTWPSSSGSAGIHTLGSARIYVGDTGSAVSSGDTTGRLMLNKEDYTLWSLNGTTINHIGSQYIMECLNTDTLGGNNRQTRTAVWIGSTGVDSKASAIVTFPGSGYSGKPLVFVTGWLPTYMSAPLIPVIPNILQISARTFEVIALSASFTTAQWAASVATIHWMSIGTVATGVA